MDYSKIFGTWWLGVVYHKEQLEELIESVEVKQYAYILHDKDIDFATSELKKPHYHFLVKFYRNLRGSFFKRFSTEDMGMVFPKPCDDPKGAFDYLIHDTPRAIKEGKYLYDASERISTIEDFEPDVKEEKLDLKIIRKLILEDKLSPREISLNYNASLNQINFAEKLYADFMEKTYSTIIRPIKVHYFYGKPRSGKTSYIYDSLNISDFYRVKQYKSPFDTYRYEKILVLDEFKGQIEITDMNNILDKFPCELPCRFFNKWAAWEEVYIISNLSPGYQYRGELPDIVDAFQQRLHNIKCFDKVKEKGIDYLKESPKQEQLKAFDDKFLAK